MWRGDCVGASGLRRLDLDQGALAPPPDDLIGQKAAIEIPFWLCETYKLLHTLITGSQRLRSLERSGAMQALAP